MGNFCSLCSKVKNRWCIKEDFSVQNFPKWLLNRRSYDFFSKEDVGTRNVNQLILVNPTEVEYI